MRVWWYHALTAVDTTGGQQMGQATNGGTGRVSCAGQLNFCRAHQGRQQFKGDDTLKIMKMCPLSAPLCWTFQVNTACRAEV